MNLSSISQSSHAFCIGLTQAFNSIVRFCVLAAMIFMVSPSIGQSINSPYLHFPGNGNTNEVVNNGTGATLQGNAAYGLGQDGNSTGSFHLDGSTGTYVDLGAYASDINNHMTGAISLWYQPAASQINNRCELISISNTVGDSFQVLYLLQNSDNTFYAILWKTHHSSNRAWGIKETQVTAVAGQWFHVLLTQDGNGIRIYVNGNDDNVVSGPQNDPGAWVEDINGNINAIHLGSMVSGAGPNGNFFANGLIDDVRIYDHGLSHADAIALYQAGVPEGNLPPPAPPAEANWQLDDLDGTTIFYNGGDVGIGTHIVPDGYVMSADGKVIAEEIKVQLSDQWPDFVFAPDYELKPLSEVQTYILENGHLPDIPSEEEVQGEIFLGEMNRKLLLKIEELTLYLLDQDKKYQTLKSDFEELKAQISSDNSKD